jgi:hypothetical protein
MRKLLFFIPVLLCTFGCRGWYTIIPDIDSVDSVVYINGPDRSRMTITNPDTIKEIANIINDGDKLLLPVIFCKYRRLSFHYKDTVICIGIGNGKTFSGSDGTYELPDDFDNLVLKYFKKPHSK